MAKSYRYRRIRKTGELEDLRKRIWQAIDVCERILLEDGHPDSERIQAVHAMMGACKVYQKVLEAEDLEDRVKALEEKFELKKMG